MTGRRSRIARTRGARDQGRLGADPGKRDPADQRRSVVAATAKGLKIVEKLSRKVEAHYDWMEKSLGKEKLSQLYALLDDLIELEQP